MAKKRKGENEAPEKENEDSKQVQPPLRTVLRSNRDAPYARPLNLSVTYLTNKSVKM